MNSPDCEADGVDAKSVRVCEDCGSLVPSLLMESTKGLSKIYSELIEDVLNQVMVDVRKIMVTYVKSIEMRDTNRRKRVFRNKRRRPATKDRTSSSVSSNDCEPLHTIPLEREIKVKAMSVLNMKMSLMTRKYRNKFSKKIPKTPRRNSRKTRNHTQDH